MEMMVLWIRRIEIAGFGVLQDWSVELEHGLQVIVGNNGEGKTTILQFIRSCLFGMVPRGHTARYEVSGFPYLGGRITLQTEGGTILVERTLGRSSAGDLRVFDQDGEQRSDQWLYSHLGRVSRTLFQQVFAITVDDLNQVDLLEGEELRSHLYSVGMNTAVSVVALERNLAARADQLYKQRGRKPVLNGLRQDLQEAVLQLRRAEERETQFQPINERLRVVESRIEEMQAESIGLETSLDTMQRANKSEVVWRQVRQLRSSLETRTHLQTQLDALNGMSLAAVEVMVEQAANELERAVNEMELAAQPKQQFEETLRRLQERLDKILPQDLQRIPVDQLVSRLRTIAADEQILRSLNSAGKWDKVVPWIWLVVVATALLWAGELAAIAAAMAAAAGMAHVVLWLLREQRRRRFEAELISQKAFFGESGLDSDVWLGKAMEAQGVQNDIAKTQVQLEYHEKAWQERVLQHERAQETWNHWLKTLSAHNLLEAQDRVQTLKRWEQDRQHVVELEDQLLLIWGEVPTELPTVNSQQLAETAEELQRLNEARQQLLEEKGRLRQELQELERQTAVTNWANEAARIREEAASYVHELAVTVALQAALEAARSHYETHKQPRLLQAASRWFAGFTLEQYRRIMVPLESRSLLVEDSAGVFWPAEHLSRGTVEQLYLALRLAVIELYSEQNVVLPIVLDEIFVNFDSGRTRAVMASLQQLAQKHQIIILTCHNDVMDAINGTAKEVKLCHQFQS